MPQWKHNDNPVGPNAERQGDQLQAQVWTWLHGRLTLAICICLIGAVVAVYWPVRNHEFIHFDDPTYVTHNPHVKAGLTPRGVAQAFTTSRDGNWFPLSWLSHMLDFQVYGLNPGGHHVTNLLFHLANTLLLFLILKRMTRRPWPSGFVAALFALHPLHVESVAWVAERKNVLSTFFWMLTMWGYIRYTEKRDIHRYLLTLLFFVLGLMSKPMLVTLPFVLLLLDYWPLGRFQPGQWRTQAWPLIREKIPLFLLSAASSVVTFIVQQGGGMVKPIDAFPLSGRLVNASVSYANYILKMLWPHDLAILYPYPEAFFLWPVFGAGLLLAGTSILVFRGAKKYPYLVVGWFWYLGTLVPVIGLVQVGLQALADRYAYVPLIGLFILIAMGVPDLLSRWPGRRVMLPTSAVAALAVLLVVARIQVSYWQNSIRLFEHTIAVTTNNLIMHNMLGTVLATKGKLQEGMDNFREALRINHRYAEAWNNLGLALAKEGKVEQAIAIYGKILLGNPNNAEAHNNLGNILNDQGKSQEAVFHLSEAVRINPDNAQAHNNLGIALAREGRDQEGRGHYIQALRIEPDYAEAHNNLGVVLFSRGDLQEAMAHYLEALRIKPDFAEAQSNLGVALAKQGKVQEAMVCFERAISIDPGYERAYHNLGGALAGLGKDREAIASYTEALRINPTFAEAHFSLGLVHAKVGNRSSALQEYIILKTINLDLAHRLLERIRGS